MIEFIFTLLFVIGCLIIRLYQVNQKKKIYYSNYKNCLKVIGEYDANLKAYLERNE